jgi:hypothetical protein
MPRLKVCQKNSRVTQDPRRRLASNPSKIISKQQIGHLEVVEQKGSTDMDYSLGRAHKLSANRVPSTRKIKTIGSAP